MSNALEQILSRLEQDDAYTTEKVAEVAAPTPSAEARMLETVQAMTNTTVKTAGDVESPSESLRELAKTAQEAEEQILGQKAASLGAALADGFMARFAQYDTALADVEVKTASSVDTDSLVKQAYAAAREDLEKQAQAEYERGYQDQLAEIQKVAAHIHLAGQQSARNVITELASEA